MYKMLSSQDSVGSNDQPIMQVTMVPNPVTNAGNQQPNLSTQATVMPAVTMATVQIPQMRVLQAIATRTEQMQHFQHPVQTMPQLTQVHQQPQQIQIIKSASSSKGDIFVPTSLQTLVGVKTPISSPGKAATAVVALQNPRMVTHANLPAKLKVGDTIVIPAKTLNTMNPSSSVGTQSIVIKNEQGTPGQLVFSTPTKLVPAVGKSPMLGSPSTPQQSQIRYASNQQPSTPASSTLTSPMRLTTISPSSWTPSPMRYKRSNDYGDQDSFSDNVKKSRRTPIGQDKGSKGLRHFAMLVCEKVKQKITTTYNEVADELVKEYATTQRHFSDQQYDQKNIRRRVYDALNVLMAMNIIYKDKKDIHWVGLPTNSAQELQSLQSEKQRREQRIKQKTAQLHELILQQIAFKNLVQRNKRLQQAQGPPASNSAIQLPFIIVNTSKKTVIDCSISNDKYEYLFNFDNTFEIHDDIEVLKRMGMAYGLEKGTCSKEDLKVAQSLVPPVLRPYLEEMAGYSKDMDALTSSTSASSSQTMDSSNGGQSSIGVQSSQIGSSPYDGHQLLSSIKHDPDDQEVALMIQEDSQGSSSSLTMTGPSSSSRSSSVDALSSIIQQGGAVPSPSFDISCLPTSSMSPGNFDT